MGEAKEKALLAKEASSRLALASLDMRNNALAKMAQALRNNTRQIVEANQLDMEQARAVGTSEALLDRLLLDDARVEDMALALEDLIALPDPLGQIQVERTLYNGLQLKRVSVPLGVVAVVYEARPNVTADAAGICLKSGNSVILRGGSLAAHSNVAVANVLADAVAQAGLPRDCIQCIESTDRTQTDELMSLHGIVDVLVPRGGAGLINHCVETSKVPVIETGTGNCHVYVHKTADETTACTIIENAKCRRYGVCNAAETLLVDKAIAGQFLPLVFKTLGRHDVVFHCDEEAFGIATACVASSEDGQAGIVFDHATQSDWETEYLAPELAVHCVTDEDEAIEHINTYGTHHSEAIVANPETEAGARAINDFLNQVDAAVVYVNASTAFTDGGQFGLGAEIGISTQKLHVRGPFALEALTSYKYLVQGTGQVRS